MSRTVKCEATRCDRVWVARIPRYGVYGHGPTLRALRESLERALALIGVNVQVAVTPVIPELEPLRAAQDAYTAALRRTVRALARQQMSVNDIAAATAVPLKQVREIVPKPPGS